MLTMRIQKITGILIAACVLCQLILCYRIAYRSVLGIPRFKKHEDAFNKSKDVEATDDIFEKKMDDCECGIFNSQNPDEKDVPILRHAPKKVSCDYTEDEMCLKLCFRLAQEAGEYGGQLFCGVLGYHSSIKASVDSRTICSSNLWNFTGFTAPNDICCSNYQVVACNQ